MNISTTSIDDLPTSIGQENTTVMPNKITDKADAKRLAENELITGIQKAASSGMTALPSRDIPMNQNAIHVDEQIKANYVPSSLEGDYITKHQTGEEIVRQNAKKQHDKDKWDDIYNEMSAPVLIAVLYFMYQLPVVRKLFITAVPMCYGKSGDINLSGRIVNCAMFGLIIYLTGKIVSHMSR